MIALDTNVLVRIVMDDPQEPRQCALARALVETQTRARVSVIVFAETLWVLSRRYRVRREDIAHVALGILDHPKLRVDEAQLLRQALDILVAGDIEFADALALCDAQINACTLHTFDQKLGRTTGASLVE